MLEQRLSKELAAIESAGLTRRRRMLESSCGRLVTVDGKKLLNFASNDYLGLANNPEISQALAVGAKQWGAGSGASHLVSGHLAPHEALEKEIAAFTGFPRALTFSTGYLANLAVTPSLAGRGDAVFADKLNHASLIDAMQQAKANGAEVQRYPHNDMAALEKMLAASTAAHKIIVSDTVFSMDGDLAPLPLLYALAEQYDAWLVLDDAHGFGVLGEQGKGSLAHFNLPSARRILLMGTLGKAAGVGGAFVAGSTTAQPPAIACALSKSLQLIQNGDALRANLNTRIRQLRDELTGLPLHLLPSITAIQPLIVGANEATVTLSKALWERGLWVPAIRPPTVPKGTARLRISLSAAHTAEDIETLSTALKELA
jgi:8-amino-7-oxononanoate synthase